MLKLTVRNGSGQKSVIELKFRFLRLNDRRGRRFLTPVRSPFVTVAVVPKVQPKNRVIIQNRVMSGGQIPFRLNRKMNLMILIVKFILMKLMTSSRVVPRVKPVIFQRRFLFLMMILTSVLIMVIRLVIGVIGMMTGIMIVEAVSLVTVASLVMVTSLVMVVTVLFMIFTSCLASVMIALALLIMIAWVMVSWVMIIVLALLISVSVKGVMVF